MSIKQIEPGEKMNRHLHERYNYQEQKHFIALNINFYNFMT